MLTCRPIAASLALGALLAASPPAHAQDPASRFSGGEAAVRARVAAISNNAAGLYWQAFDALTKLTERQQELLLLTNATPEEVQVFQEQLAPTLALQAQAQSMPVCDWGLDYSAGPAMLLPHVRGARQLVKAANWDAALRLATEPDAAVERYLGNLELSRRVADSAVLISVLVANACESITYAQLAQDLPRLPSEEVDRLAAYFESATPSARWKTAVENERDYFAGWMLNLILGAAHSNTVTSTAAEESAEVYTNSLAQELRLTALLQGRGQPLRVGFDDARNQRSFWLSPGETEFGVTLVSCDYEREEALLTRDGETATIHLKGLEIQPFELRLSPEQYRELTPFLGSKSTDVESANYMLKVGGPQGMVRDLLMVQEIETEWSALTGWKSLAELEAMESAAQERLGPFGRTHLMSLTKVYQSIFAAQVRDQLIRAAVALERGDTEARNFFPDPTDGAPFDILTVGDGYALISRATSSPRNEPIRLRVGL